MKRGDYIWFDSHYDLGYFNVFIASGIPHNPDDVFFYTTFPVSFCYYKNFTYFTDPKEIYHECIKDLSMCYGRNTELVNEIGYPSLLDIKEVRERIIRFANLRKI